MEMPLGPRQDWTFAEVLDWHLMHGTRPSNSPTGAGRPWSNKEFARALEREANERTIRNWRSGAYLPADLYAIERVLFGDAEHHTNWRHEIREAYRNAKRRDPNRDNGNTQLYHDRGQLHLAIVDSTVAYTLYAASLVNVVIAKNKNQRAVEEHAEVTRRAENFHRELSAFLVDAPALPGLFAIDEIMQFLMNNPLVNNV